MSRTNLVCLERVDISMYWYSFFINNKYSWISNQFYILLSLYFKYFLYYSITKKNLYDFLEFDQFYFSKKTQKIKNKIEFEFIEKSFFTPVTIYLIDNKQTILLFVLFYYTHLNLFKKKLTLEMVKKNDIFKSSLETIEISLENDELKKNLTILSDFSVNKLTNNIDILQHYLIKFFLKKKKATNFEYLTFFWKNKI